MKKCWAESYCKMFNEQRTNCHAHCIGYIQLQNLYSMSNMPKKYQYDMPLVPDDIDRQSFLYLKEWKENVKENVEQGRGLFLYSKTKGTGKTSWACKIANEYARHVALKNNLRCRILFVPVPGFLDEMRQNMNNPTEEFQEMRENIKKADLVIWDDIGTESPTNWVREQLYIFINNREANGLSQIFTSNVDLELLKDEKYLGERIVSRIVGSCDLIEFKSKIDRRLSR